jgi:hypothetical protein
MTLFRLHRCFPRPCGHRCIAENPARSSPGCSRSRDSSHCARAALAPGHARRKHPKLRGSNDLVRVLGQSECSWIQHPANAWSSSMVSRLKIASDHSPTRASLPVPRPRRPIHNEKKYSCAPCFINLRALSSLAFIHPQNRMLLFNRESGRSHWRT